MEIDNLKYEFVIGLRKYHHTRRYVVSNDIVITLTKGKVCYIEQKKCLSALVKYHRRWQSLTQPRHQIATKLDEETFTIKYWSKDDAGNKFSVKKTFRLNGGSHQKQIIPSAERCAEKKPANPSIADFEYQPRSRADDPINLKPPR